MKLNENDYYIRTDENTMTIELKRHDRKKPLLTIHYHEDPVQGFTLEDGLEQVRRCLDHICN